MSDQPWPETKAEDKESARTSSPSVSKAQWNAYSAAPEANFMAGQNVFESEQGPQQTRTTLSTPSERQRTAQACDKCRERKTKCSGDHPVCHRCTTRGLICQYSSREPRPRGTAKSRLRNAISSADLRSSSSNMNSFPVRQTPLTQSTPQQPPSQAEPSHQFRTFELQQSTHHQPQQQQKQQQVPGHRRVASIPRSHYDGQASGHYRTSPLAYSYDAFKMSSFVSEPQSSYATQHVPLHMDMQATHFGSHAASFPHLRDVRRVQSHSSLLMSGSATDQSSGLGMQNSLAFPSHLSVPYNIGAAPSQMPGSSESTPKPYEHHLRRSMFDNSGQYSRQLTQMRPWSYHSDGTSSGSEVLSATDGGLAYSPASSEDNAESNTRSTSSPPASMYPRISKLGNLTRFSDLGDAPLHGRFNPAVHTAEGENIIEGGLELVYPTPVTPIGIGMMGEGEDLSASKESFQKCWE